MTTDPKMNLTLGRKEPKKTKADEKHEAIDKWFELISAKVKLWHTTDDTTYADIREKDSFVTVPIRSGRFERLVRSVIAQDVKVPATNIVDAFIASFESLALGGECKDIVIRKGTSSGQVVLDMADPDGRAVVCTPSGWQITPKPPVRFFRPLGTGSLAAPQPGGNLDLLRKYVRVTNDREYYLLLGWLLGCYNPHESYPILILNGEQGSSKSTLTSIMRRLIDPHSSSSFQPPREDRELRAYVKNSFLLPFDNVSTIQQWFSDDLCRIATGSSALTTRTLYTTAELTSIKAVRPTILNGIPDFVERGDLMDRCIQITLPVIPKDQRKTEDAFWAEFEKDYPLILGAIYDTVCFGLGQPSVKYAEFPRMADWAEWICRVCPKWGQTPEQFLDCYWRSKNKAEILLIQHNAFADALLQFLESNPNHTWQGNVKQLRNAMAHLAPVNQEQVGWPIKDLSMTNEIKRISPLLRNVGIEHSTYTEGRYIKHAFFKKFGKVLTSATP